MYKNENRTIGIDLTLKECILNEDIRKYIDRICLKYGSSYEGRLKSFTYVTGIKYKRPLIVSNKFNIYFLITRSINANDVIFINYSKLKEFHSVNKYKTKLLFYNGMNTIINVDYRIIKRQNDKMKQYLYRYNEI